MDLFGRRWGLWHIVFVCQLEIKVGQEVVYYFSKAAFRHGNCTPPKTEKKIPTQEEIRKSQFGHCGTSKNPKNKGWDTEVSPWQENAIGDMEGD